QRQAGSKVHRTGRFPDTTLLIGDRENPALSRPGKQVPLGMQHPRGTRRLLLDRGPAGLPLFACRGVRAWLIHCDIPQSTICRASVVGTTVSRGTTLLTTPTACSCCGSWTSPWF